MFDPVAYINEPRWRSMSLGLERIEELLAKLGNPQDTLRFVHVAGTNGKGSTCSFVSSILEESGYKVGLFTSPYIERFEERIRINGENISLQRLSEVTLKVKDAAEAMASHTTEFELMTAVAFTYFAEEKCDIVVAEVGLGGRLDSTNVIRTVEVCVFAPISYDHCALLGSTLYQIAGEKAGILKTGIPAVSAPQEQEAQRRLNEEADRCATSIRYVDASSIDGDTSDFSYDGFSHLSVQLQGSFQRTNAAVALEACRVLVQRGWNIDEQVMRSGLSRASWAGRFEFLRRSPDPACNPYLEMASCLAAGLDGIERDLPVPAPTDANIYTMTPEERLEAGVHSLPKSLEEATKLFAASPFMKEVLGSHVYNKYLEAKREEWRSYRARVSQWEVDRYLVKY